MTEPTVTPVLKPTKSWIAFGGALLAGLLPVLAMLGDVLPKDSPWLLVITVAVAIGTRIVTYLVPNKETGKVIVDASPAPRTYDDIQALDITDYYRDPGTGPFQRPSR